MMSSHDYKYPFKYHEEVQLMALFIETLTGTTFEVTVSPYDTVISIKAKIQRIEGIPVSQQHLLYNLKELEDSAFLKDYSLHDGATVKLVLSMRGGPISTVRRILPLDDAAWRELVNLNKEEMLDDLPPGCRMAILIFREGDHLNLLRVLENLDGSYSPFSEICCGSSICHLFEEDDSSDCNKRLEENTVTMEKMNELKTKLEELSVQRKVQKGDRDANWELKEEVVPSLIGSPPPLQNNREPRSMLHLPPLGHRAHEEDSLLKSRTEFTRVPVLPDISPRASPEVSPRFAIVDSNDEPMAVAGSRLLLDEARPKTSPDHLTDRQLCEILSEAGRHRHALLQTHCSASSPVKSIRRSTSNVEFEPDWGSSSSNNTTSTSVRTHRPFKIPTSEKLIPSSDRSSPNFSSSKYSEKDTELPILSSTYRSTSSSSFKSEVGKVNRTPITKPLRNVIPERNRDSGLYATNKSSKIPVNQINRISSKSNLLTHSISGKSGGFLTMPLSTLRTGMNMLPSIRGITSELSMYESTGNLLPSDIRRVNDGTENDRENLNKPLKTDSSQDSAELGKNEHRIGNISIDDSNCRSSSVDEQLSEPNLKKKENKKRCAQCRKRLTLTNVYTCRCGNMFCSTHRYSETHNCSFDYKKEGRKILEQANPVVTAPKLPKI